MLLVIGQAHDDQGDYDAALRSYERAVQDIGPGERSQTLAQAEEYLAGLLYERGDFPKAREWFTKSREAALKLDYKDGVAAATAGLAEIAGNLGHDADARLLLEQGREATAGKGLGHEFLERASGDVALASGQYSAAVRQFLATLEPGKVDEEDLKCSLTTRLGLALVRSGRRREGFETCARAAKLADTQHNPEQQAAAALAIAEAYLATGRRMDAAPVLRRLLPYLEKTGRRESAWRAFAMLAQAESGMAAAADAQRARDTYHQLIAGWDNSDVQAYKLRPDIRKLLSVVESMSKGEG
jgi:tetratricopeptide (TPR) repeat protein